ncbi:MAG TPA: GAF domain-containing sensor histidine kinase [Abditibacteriaceae bacterium]|nr:GAF domain-containing sensor histidine kinase [Abditibacteriaceae bacterium]
MNASNQEVSSLEATLVETIYAEPGAESVTAPLQASRLEQLEQRVAELEEVLEHRERQIDAMGRTSNALFSHTSVDDMIRETLRLAIDVLDADAGSLSLHNPQDNTLVFRHVVGPAADKLIGFVMPVTQGIAGHVFRTGTPDLTQKVHDRPDFNSAVDKTTGYNTESMMTVPVKRAEGAPIGVMQVLNARRAFDERDLEVLEVLCAQAASAIAYARLAQEARKAAMISMVGDISHDIKNMLTPIQSGVWTLQPLLDQLFVELDEICREYPQTDDIARKIAHATDGVRRDYGWILEAALDAAEKVKTRTKEIADAFKGELSAPVFEDADLNAVAREVAQSLRPVAASTHVHIRLELEDALPLACFDRKQMYNALYNLVNNAIPETPAGGSVTIRTCLPEPGHDSFVVEVEDTGRGMPEEVLQRLFTDDAISTKPGGTGMGTRIVAGIVQRHHGTIKVDSVEGQGSKFSIRLPLRQPD